MYVTYVLRHLVIFLCCFGIDFEMSYILEKSLRREIILSNLKVKEALGIALCNK